MKIRFNAATAGMTEDEVSDIVTEAVKDLVRNNGPAVVLDALAEAVIENQHTVYDRAESEEAVEAAHRYTGIVTKLGKAAEKASEIMAEAGW